MSGRVVREHVSGGVLGQLVAQLVAVECEERLVERAAVRAERDEMAAIDSLLDE